MSTNRQKKDSEDFQLYSFGGLRHKEVKAVTDVPGDGWCMLYAAQVASCLDADISFTLNELRTTLVRNFFTNKGDAESIGLPGRVPQEFARVISYRKCLQSSNVSEFQESLIPSAFLLFDFIENRYFNNCFVDLLPCYISQVLDMRVNIYRLHVHSDSNDEVTLEERPFITVGVSTRKKEINLLLVNEHYAAGSHVMPTVDELSAIKKLNDEPLVTLPDMLFGLKLAPIFKEMAFYFPTSKVSFQAGI